LQLDHPLTQWHPQLSLKVSLGLFPWCNLSQVYKKGPIHRPHPTDLLWLRRP
jgi:hypothetical protein